MLDCLTEGRLAAGFPVGTSMDVNRCYGVTPTETRPRFYEAHDLIIKAWTQPGPFAYNGRFNKLRYVNPWPQPLQQPHPPVWLAGGGSVETYEMAVRARLHVQLPQLPRLPLRQEGDGHVLGDGRPPRRRRQPVPGRLRPADLRGRDRRRGQGAVPRARHLLLQEVPPRAALLHGDAGLPHPPQRRVHPEVQLAGRDRRRGDGAQRLGHARRAGLRDRREPRDGHRAADRGLPRPARRQPRGPVADRLDAPRPHGAEHHDVRRAGDATAARGLGRRGLGAQVVAPGRPPGARRWWGRDGARRAHRRGPRRPVQDPRPGGGSGRSRARPARRRRAVLGRPHGRPGRRVTASSRPSIPAPVRRRGSSTSRTCGISCSTTTSCSTCSGCRR